MVRRWMARFGACAVLVLATGCASVTGGNTQKMYVQVNDGGGQTVEGADCTLANDKGSWNLRAPNDTTVVRSNKPMAVTCNTAGLPQGSVSIESATRAAMFGNILIGGLVGAAIDHTSGAAYEYPGIATVTLGQATAVKMDYVAGRPGSGGPTAVPRTLPGATGFADINDANAVPNLTPNRREHYQRFLATKPPRAFVVADNTFEWANGLKPADAQRPSDPSQRALERCRERGGINCRLYAVDNAVVYNRTNAAVAVARPAPVELPPAAPKTHRFKLPPASGYADAQDAGAVPVRSEGQGRYLHYLTLTKPKAFVVHADGGWNYAHNNAAALADVLHGCERAGKPCWLYAVDDEVVWQTDPARRIGKASQLVPLGGVQ